MAEKRLFKLQIMISDSELEEIDDFRFDTRSESRAAAVRDLIREGLASWRARQGESGDDKS